MPSIRGHRRRGDLYVKVNVKIPKKLNQKQRDLLQAFAEAEGVTPSGKRAKVRDFLKKMAQ
jgi:molecular chaperone DnaJ